MCVPHVLAACAPPGLSYRSQVGRRGVETGNCYQPLKGVEAVDAVDAMDAMEAVEVES